MMKRIERALIICIAIVGISILFEDQVHTAFVNAVKLLDGAGTAITSSTEGSYQPLHVAIIDPASNGLATLNGDATMGSTAIATGPQVMGDCDDTSTVAVTEGQAGRMRINCTTRSLMMQFVPPTTNEVAVSECLLVSAASTNATNCKNAPGNFYGLGEFINTTATLYYLRMYNTSSSPTCSSATGFIRSIPIPASATGAGITSVRFYPTAYSTGISFCFTGGSSSTDNTNAATGVFGTVLYK